MGCLFTGVMAKRCLYVYWSNVFVHWGDGWMVFVCILKKLMIVL